MNQYAQTIRRSMMSFAAVMLAIFLVSRADAQDATPLEPGKPITRTAKRQQVDTYQLTLNAGQFIRVLVEQNELDVSVELVAPDNKPAYIVNASRSFGSDSLSWEAATSGAYKIMIRTLFTHRSEGSYQIQMTLKDAATTQDKQRIAAERLLTEIFRAGAPPLPEPQRQENYQQALRIWRELGDRPMEAQTHEVMGYAYNPDRKFEQARECFKQALQIRQELLDQLAKIVTISNIGLYARIERNTSSDRNSERSQQLMKQDEEYQLQALALSREIKHRGAERFVLNILTGTYNSLNLPEKTIAVMEQVLAIDRESRNRADEANTLRFLGQSSSQAKREEVARRYYEQSLSIFRELKDRAGEANTLRALGSAYSHVNRYENAYRSYEEALSLFREVNDQLGATALLFSLGDIAARLGRYEDSQRYYDDYMATFRTTKNRKGEAEALFRIGYSNQLISRFDKALSYYALALPIHLELKNRTGEAEVYREYGNTYGMMGHYDKALENYERSLPIWRELKNRLHEGSLLNNIGFAYGKLNRQEKAIEYLEQAVAIHREIKNPWFESGALDNLASAYRELGQYEKAIEHAEQALTIVRGMKILADEGFFLNTLGLIFHKQGKYEKAAESFEGAIRLLHTTKWRAEEGSAHSNLADTLREQAQIDKAITADLRALQIAREVKALDNESFALTGLMKDWQARKQPQLAILFGKQAVNASQEMRSNFSRLDRETQTSFLKSKESTYRELADLLIAQGRLPEAEQVIRMLKEEEYFEYVRRDINDALKSEKAALTPEEAAIEKRYREIGDKLSEIGSQRSDLLGKPARTIEEEQLLAKLEADLTVAGQMFQKFLDGLAVEMAKQKDGSANITKLRDAQGLMEDLRELGKGVVALYTLVGENKYRVILTTADFQRAYEYPIKAADLNRKILAFRTALQNPKLDPLPLAQELYKILVAPVAKDLRGTKAQMLMWSLDGVLRYVPVAALHDGEKYLVERFRNAVFTPASNARFKDEPSRNWKVLGLGVTKSFGPNIPALPGVAEEMRGIINDGASGKGVLPGTIKLDEHFTQEAMLAGLRQRNPVVHVASHFQFKPGNETDSALLLGDGKFLSLAQIKALPQVFSGVELLTLSACDTATSSSGANGKEVEGFGVTAQKQGAKAVIASLWPVADRSTKNLMQEFYRLRETKGNVTKAEAMRQAQIKLLRGDLQVTGETMAARDIVHETDKTANLPPYKVDPKAPYAHPYYWAPFILIGNWK